MTGSWISHQVSEFLARVTSYPDESSALRGGIEHAAEALEAEVAAVVRGASIVLSIGLIDMEQAETDLLRTIENGGHQVALARLDTCQIAVADLEDGLGSRLVVARAGEDPFGRDEQSLLDNMGRTLGLVLRMLRTLDNERAALRDLEERQLLLERLARIQGSISHRAPLQEVLDSITEGVNELMRDEFAVIRLVDPEDARFLLLASASSAMPDALREKIKRIRNGEGVAGRSIQEHRLVIFEDYAGSPGAIPELVNTVSLRTAMAVPLYVEGAIVGSLVTGTQAAGRTYSEAEQEMLKALAESASIALTDAQTVESMREARRTKETFLTMVSHELKTPLTVMLGALHTLRNRLDELPDGMKKDLLDSAVRRGDDLKRLIDMLLGAQADLVGARERIVLPAFVAEAVRRSEAVRPITITSSPGVIFWSDAVALHQIVGTLLDNATTHSPEGSEIQFGATATSSEVSVFVRNRGSLPDDVDIDALFAPFERGPAASSSGIGLGLYVARSLAESIEGDIDVSNTGETIEFTLRFPAKVESDQDLSATG